MIDAVPDKKVVKLNVTIDDDINLILDAVSKVAEAYVLVVVPEGNDLINSPIGLKALRKKTLEKGKRMILVVPPGAAYELTKKAGFIATTSQDAVTSDLWQTTMQQYEEYHHANVGMNSKKDLPKVDKSIEYMNPVTSPLPVPEIVSGSRVIEQQAQLHSDLPAAVPVVPKVDELTRDLGPKITGIDFSRMMKQGSSTGSFSRTPKPTPHVTPNIVVAPNEINTFHPDISPKKVGGAFGKVAKKREFNPVVGLIGFGILGVLIIAITSFVAYYLFFPRIRIELEEQSDALTLNSEVLATSAVTGFDVNKKEIQLTKEKAEKTATLPFTATGQSSSGTKASGLITLTNSGSLQNIPSGTLVTSGQLKFVTQATVAVAASSADTTVSILASDFGQEYNLAAGSSFVVSGFATVTGANSAAFTGGLKNSFTVVSQQDADKIAKSLQDQLGKDATGELQYLNADAGYVYIPESVITTLKDKATFKPAVGSQVATTDEQPTVTLTTVTTALYYHKESLTKLGERLLIEKYRVDKTLSNEAAANIEMKQLDIKVTKVTVDKNEKVTVAFTAKALATTRIDIDKLRTDIIGKEWAEMLDYVAKLPALAKAPDVKFFPTWFPDFLRYVPKDVGRVDVSVKVVAPEGQVSQ